MTDSTPPPSVAVDDVLRRALAEDLGVAGDVTTSAIFPAGSMSRGRIVARKAGVVAGLEASTRVFALLDGEVEVTRHVEDGDPVEALTTLATLSGSSRAILGGERTCLNLLGHLSGIATATHAFVTAIADLPTRVVDTRKTTPGLRSLEKYAVRCGGGSNHRFGLHDAVMIKDNHLTAAGSIAAAVAAVRRNVGHLVKVELEIDDLEQLDEALAAEVDVVLLDNMAVDRLRKAVEIIDGRMLTEASGGITHGTVREVAETGVDIISIGWITHSAPRLDVALDLDT